MNQILWKIKAFEELSVAELYEILQIRQQVFIVEQTCYYLDADGSDEKAVHIWAEKNGQIVAYCRIFDENIKYPEASIGRVLTHPAFRNVSLGKVLLGIAINTIETKFRTNEVRISAQNYLLRFYEEFGFRKTGKSYLEDDIPHTEMLRTAK
ncbi:MAG: GNAT family N-acetyltransferase [Kaistella sp.]